MGLANGAPLASGLGIGLDADDEEEADDLVCASCGRLLDGDPDEDPFGNAGLPICGECERNRNMDAEEEFA